MIYSVIYEIQFNFGFVVFGLVWFDMQFRINMQKLYIIYRKIDFKTIYLISQTNPRSSDTGKNLVVPLIHHHTVDLRIRFTFRRRTTYKLVSMGFFDSAVIFFDIPLTSISKFCLPPLRVMYLRCSCILAMCLEHPLATYHGLSSSEFSETSTILHRSSSDTDIVLTDEVDFVSLPLVIPCFKC